jgi:hypothetical protein
MASCTRTNSSRAVLLATSLCWAGGSWCADFAPEGASGVLQISVVVDGAGTEQAAPKAGVKSRSWSVKHSATYRVTMVPQPPVINGETPITAGGSPDAIHDDAYWEAKTEACGGEPACEMQVVNDQMNDPAMQQQMQQLGVMMSAAQTAPGGVPNAQTWRIASRAGNVRIEQHDDAFGVVSEAGGLVDVRCTNSVDKALDSKPPVALGPMPAVITIDANSSSYTLQLPIEDSFVVKRLCNDGGEPYEESPRGPAPLLGDRPTGESGWSPTLSVHGTFSGGAAAPAFEGRKVVRADVLGAPNRTATVTIAWRFR